MKNVINFILDYWPLLGPLVYEILARLWPTKWNISILDNLWKFINTLIPNNRIPDGNESGLKTNARGEVVNNVTVKMSKHILRALLIVCLFGSIACAQTWKDYKGIRLVNERDTTEQLAIEGSIYYDDTDNIFYGRDQFGWKNLLSGGGSGGNFWKTDGASELTATVVIEGDGITERSVLINTRPDNTVAHAKLQLYEGSSFLQRFEPGTPFRKNEVVVGDLSTYLRFTSSADHNLRNDVFLNPDGIQLLSQFPSGGTFLFTTPTDELTLNDNTFLSNNTITLRPTDDLILESLSGDVAINENIVLNPVNNTSDLFGGEFTPTLTNVNNVSSATLIPSSATYIIVGDIVRAELGINITPTASATNTQLNISLPVPNVNITVLSGIGIEANGTQNGSVEANGVDNTAMLNFESTGTSVSEWRVSFQYVR